MALLVGGDFAKKQIFKEKTILESTKTKHFFELQKMIKKLAKSF